MADRDQDSTPYVDALLAYSKLNLATSIVNADISARVTAEHELQASLAQMRGLTGRLMRAQDDERRPSDDDEDKVEEKEFRPAQI